MCHNYRYSNSNPFSISPISIDYVGGKVTMQNVAVLGLGIMGGGMADNLLKAGFHVSVYNRTRTKTDPFAAKGARVANTPCEAAQEADVIISMVGDDDASRAVWLGDDG